MQFNGIFCKRNAGSGALIVQFWRGAFHLRRRTISTTHNLYLDHKSQARVVSCLKLQALDIYNIYNELPIQMQPKLTQPMCRISIAFINSI